MTSGYFDYAAATPMSDEVLLAMQPFFADKFYNPSADYGPARDVRLALNEARRQIAELLGVKPVEVIFTAGATEANNLAIRGIMNQFPEANLVISAIEHDSVRAPSAKYDRRELPVGQDGVVQTEKLKEIIDDQTVLISIMLANNEIGSIQPLADIGRLVREVRILRSRSGNDTPLFIHCDAAQAGNYLDLHAHRLGVDMLTVNGGKLYGPKQSGVLFVSSGVVLEPLIDGGGQERGLRSGTENVAAAIGLAEALKVAQSLRHEEAKRLRVLQTLFFNELSQKIPETIMNGSKHHRLPNNVHFTIPGQDNERLLILLDQAGVCAAAGSACSASHDEPSHVLKAIGLNDDEIRASLRFSMGRGTTETDVKRAVEALVRALK